jgi:PHP domain-containing protein
VNATAVARSLAVIVLAASAGSFARADALAKLKLDKLEAVHKAIADLRSQREEITRTGPYREFRANLHVHSSLSHDSRGTIENIVTAAKAAGTRVLMFTEHPSDKVDFFTGGHQGMKDGVLLIPGAETDGFLVYPTHSLRGLEKGKPQEFCDLVRRRGGLMFLCHLEERMDWEINGLTGTEIYNTHADLKDEKNLLKAMRNPLFLVKMGELSSKYPQETFSALQDYPADYLRKWDQLCEKFPHTGVAANDSHQNVGLVIRLVEGNKARVEDPLGEKLAELNIASVAKLQEASKGKKVGDVLYRLQLDPYEISLRHVGTHLLLTELSKEAVWDALEAGRAFVAFDWLADAAGFDFAAVSARQRHEMGSRVAFEKGLQLRGQSPLPAKWRLVRNGKVVSESTGRTLEFPVTEPGIYRAEAWLNVAGEDMIWVLSNPVYIRP